MQRKNFIRLSTFAASAWLLTDVMQLYAAGKSSDLSFSPDPLLRIAESGQITVFIIKQEMGQKVMASLPLLVAEELEVDPASITVETLPYDASKSGDYTTWASASIKGTWMHLRKAGATAKTMLVTAAAARWKVAADLCKAEDGKVINTISNEFFLYKDLVKEASALTPPAKADLKSVRDFKVVGKRIIKTTTPAIVTGKYAYTMDVKLPGMLYAALVRCPVYNGEIKDWDSSALNGLKGFVKAVPVTQMNDALNRNAVAVIATNTWAALEGQRLLKVQWHYPTATIGDSEALFNQFKNSVLTEIPARVFGKEKNETFKSIAGKDVFRANYEVQYLAHACMEPMNCTAWYKDGKFEIWGGFQAPVFINNVLPKLFGIESSAIKVNLMPMGGSFGRREKIDNVADVMQLTKAMNAPVQMMCNRVDDLQADFYRPASFHNITAVSSPNKIAQWRHQLGIATFPGKDISGPWHMLGGVTNDLCYAVEDYQSAFYPVESPIPLGSWRSIAFAPNVFVIESFIDELAAHHRIDPVTFRFNILKEDAAGDTARLKNVLSRCADQIGWWQKPAKGRYRGIACCLYGHGGSLVAHAMEISVNPNKKIKIHRIVAAVDCGLVIDTNGLKAQVEGSLVWALSGMLRNEITVSGGRVDQQSFGDYEVLRMNEMPPFEIILIEGGETPGGGGEPAVPSVAPALCNAIYAATGTRVRTLPIKKQGFSLL